MTDELSPQWWTVPEALAWLGFGQRRAVEIVRRGSDLEREAGGNPENPRLLELPRGVKTPRTPEGMLGGRIGDMVDGPRTLAGYCREKRLDSEGRPNGSGQIEPIPVEDWRDGKLEWRDPDGSRDYDRQHLFLVLPDGRIWSGLHFRRDQLVELWRGIESATFHGYSTREEAEAAEAKIWPLGTGSASRVIMGRPEGAGIDDSRILRVIRWRIKKTGSSKSAAINWLLGWIGLHDAAQIDRNRSRLLRKLREGNDR